MKALLALGSFYWGKLLVEEVAGPLLLVCMGQQAPGSRHQALFSVCAPSWFPGSLVYPARSRHLPPRTLACSRRWSRRVGSRSGGSDGQRPSLSLRLRLSGCQAPPTSRCWHRSRGRRPRLMQASTAGQALGFSSAPTQQPASLLHAAGVVVCPVSSWLGWAARAALCWRTPCPSDPDPAHSL